MDPATILSLADLLLTGVEKLAPTIGQLVQSGQIAADQQSQLLGRIAKIQSGEAFTGANWQPQG